MRTPGIHIAHRRRESEKAGDTRVISSLECETARRADSHHHEAAGNHGTGGGSGEGPPALAAWTELHRASPERSGMDQRADHEGHEGDTGKGRSWEVGRAGEPGRPSKGGGGGVHTPPVVPPAGGNPGRAGKARRRGDPKERKGRDTARKGENHEGHEGSEEKETGPDGSGPSRGGGDDPRAEAQGEDAGSEAQACPGRLQPGREAGRVSQSSSCPRAP